jgi:NAD(P)-dependent dehydrogenase (short-subunit alcohol dehydrogenase family)
MPRVLITGANRGIGLEFVRQYAADGWQVVACCRKPEKAEALKKINGEVSIEALDVADDEQIARLATRLRGQPIDLLINNAGVYGSAGKIDADSWLEVLRVNTIAPYRLAEKFAANVARSEHRLIVSITSMMGSIAENDSGGVPMYRSSKAALNMTMKSLSIDLKDRGISVVVLHPGWVRTDMGGRSAPLAVQGSVGSLRKTIRRLKPSDSGKFLNYDGKPVPW